MLRFFFVDLRCLDSLFLISSAFVLCAALQPNDLCLCRFLWSISAFLEAEAQEQQKLHEATSAAQREASIAAGIAPTSDTTSAEVSGEGGQQPPVASQPAARITTIFHGRSEVNFQGLSWISRPQGFKERDEDQQNYLPKK